MRSFKVGLGLLRPIAFVLLCWGASFDAFADGVSASAISELRTRIEAIMQSEGVPAMSIVLVQGGEVAWQAGLGSEGGAEKVPVTDRTVFRIGDLSKSFIALSVIKLQEQGRLKLTDTLEQWAPEIALQNPWQGTDPVRIVHLLEHTSGLPDMNLAAYAYDAKPAMPLKRALEVGSDSLVVRWRPGSRASQSSVGPALAAYVVEKVTGQRFEDFVRENFFLPIGMTSATYFEPTKDFAGQYSAGGLQKLPYWNDLYRPSAAINASASDMANFLLFLIHRGNAQGRQLISSDSIERMERPETLPMVALGVNVAPSLGLLNTIEDGVRLHGHFGIVNGGLSEILYVPERRSGIFIAMNSLSENARSRVLQLLVEILAKGAPTLKPSPPATLDADLLENFGGYYVDESPQSERLRFVGDITSLVHVDLSRHAAVIRNVIGGGTNEWVAYSGRTFRQEDQSEPMVAMFRDQDGDLVMQSKWGTMRRVSAVRALTPLVIGLVSIVLMLTGVVSGVVWCARWPFTRWRSKTPAAIILPPSIASFIFLLLCIVIAGSKNIASLWGEWGSPTPASVSVFVLGIGFLLLSLLSVANLYRLRGANTRRASHWHLVAVSAACLTSALALTAYRAIGEPIWMQ